MDASLRGFQQAVLEKARERNVVLVGATGIGKTFVAISLLCEQDYSAGRRAFFMAPTRQLVWQITAKIRERTTLRVGAFCGSSMDLWDAHDWAREMALYRVFVCTPEVVRNVLERGYVALDQINLMVFDECHHVTKRHPYAQIVKLYDAAAIAPSAEPPSRLPRIFGTTACPTQHTASHLHADLYHVKMEERETVEFAAAAPLLLEMYGDNEIETDQVTAAGGIEDVIKQAVQVAAKRTRSATAPTADVESVEQWMEKCFRGTPLERLLKELEDLKAVPVLRKLLSKGQSSAAQDPERREKLVRRFVLTASEVYQNLGLWCFFKLVELEIERCAINASLLLLLES
ncbi:hypothetical protein P43SY_006504 [Pythium insidiosum]|uniref:Helicase ATP-binding domain-containing protein n=1 Tax=Pythium insidiosum TaxID=114742 RepID=A0AAD5L7U6_PYTIN|nr:hypothetical protein P43SY_006504 [Pythium insidiosum]KAJ0394807.1 hypothetical protein ATCC90586_001522 [Pythium insidiosum]